MRRNGRPVRAVKKLPSTVSLHELAALTNLMPPEIERYDRHGWYRGLRNGDAFSWIALPTTEILVELDGLRRGGALTFIEAREVADDVIKRELPHVFHQALARREPRPLGYMTTTRKVVTLYGIVRAARLFKQVTGLK